MFCGAGPIHFFLPIPFTPHILTSPQRKAAEKVEKAPRGKGKKDPNAPKRALSAYMFFSQDWRERIKTENPEAGFGEVGKLLGAKWKELDDEEKKPYVDQAAKDKTRAEDEKNAYEVSLGVGRSKEVPLTKTRRQSGKKSAPASGGEEDDEED
ncbi:high mobility group box domain-containing protein [Mycena rosella]|uniref:High mobility group box domain-containing protein n=1 Tax=Mycena rosella TaxID=1033263 RepID=A0AAD7G9Y4_MYCRO|nr:high mobility group box domain-containing protein [Mycena rosella]